MLPALTESRAAGLSLREYDKLASPRIIAGQSQSSSKLSECPHDQRKPARNQQQAYECRKVFAIEFAVQPVADTQPDEHDWPNDRGRPPHLWLQQQTAYQESDNSEPGTDREYRGDGCAHLCEVVGAA